MNQVSGAEAQIRAKVRMVVADESLWGVLSTGCSCRIRPRPT
jgi:hypothetical protein